MEYPPWSWQGSRLLDCTSSSDVPAETRTSPEELSQGPWKLGLTETYWIWTGSLPSFYLHVNTVGISAPNMMKSIEKKRKPVLLKTLLASLPMLRYSKPISTPIAMWEISRRWVRTWQQEEIGKMVTKVNNFHQFSPHKNIPLARMKMVFSAVECHPPGRDKW